VIERLAITRRNADGMRRILAALPRVQRGKPGRMGRSDLFGLVLDVAEADLMAEGHSTKSVEQLRAKFLASRSRGD
jgi:poly(A) polymerase